MKQNEFSQLRILLVSGKTHSAGTLRAVLGIAGVTRIMQVEETRRAIELLSMEMFDAVFADEASQPHNGLSFPKAVRQTASILNPMVPVFVFHERARRRAVEQARDTGATDFITCPISPRTVMDKLRAAMIHPRPFIKAPEFFGPDRRAKVRPAWAGQDRRLRVPKKIRIQLPVRDPSDTVLL